MHVDDAAAAAVAALDWPPGAVNVVDDEPAAASVWVPVFCAAVGAPTPAPIPAPAPAWDAALAGGTAPGRPSLRARGEQPVRAAGARLETGLAQLARRLGRAYT